MPLNLDELRVAPLSADTIGDFFRLHSDRNGEGWCHCVAWWTPSWEGWGERTAEQNRALRMELFARGEFDGYLLYRGSEPVAWCQVGRRDRLSKLVRQFAIEPDSSIWAVTCFVVAPPHRRMGLARFLLEQVLRDLAARGVRTVQGFPRRGDEGGGAQWTGPEALFRSLGFRVARDDPSRPIMEKSL